MNVAAREHRQVMRDTELLLLPLTHGVLEGTLRPRRVVGCEPGEVAEAGAEDVGREQIAALASAVEEQPAPPRQLPNVPEEIAGVGLVQLRRIQLPGAAAALEQH